MPLAPTATARPALALALLLSLSACDASAPADGLDAGTVALPDGARVSEAGIELPDTTVVLALEDDGHERGVATTDADGTALLWSPVHEALLTYRAADEAGDAQPGVEVIVDLDAARLGRFLVIDPSGRLMPQAFSATLPVRGDGELEVDGRALLELGTPNYDFDPSEGDPFALTIAGVSISVSISGILTSIALSGAIMIAKEFVLGVCSALAPLHDDTCAHVGTVVDVLGAIATAGVKLAGDFTLRAIGRYALEQLGEAIVDRACEAGGNRIALWAWGAPTDPGWDATRSELRRALWMYNYLLHLLDTAPPADVPALQADLLGVARILHTIAPMARPGYVQVIAPDAHAASDQFDRLTGYVTEVIDETSFTIADPDIARAWGPSRVASGLVLAVDTAEADRPIYMIDERFSTALGCVITAANRVVVGFEDTTVAAAEASTSAWVKTAAEVAMARMQDLHRTHFGGEPPPPACEADFYEPNATWREASASGRSLTIGTDPVRIDGLTLCSLTGTAFEEDWYAFDMGPISLNAGARVRAPTSGSMMGLDERVCVEVWFYSESYEISGWDAEMVAGPACGRVRDEPATEMFSIGRTLGESYSFLIAHVYPEGATTATQIDYELAFTL